MTPSTRVLVGLVLLGCGGSKPAAEPTQAAPAGEPSASALSPATPADSAAPESAASAAPAASAAEPAQPPKQRGAPVEVSIVGKNAGDAALERVVKGAQTGLQNCYEAGLEGTPTAKGVVDFKIHVTASGTLKKVESANPNTMPGSVTNCMVGKFGALSFEPRPATIIEVKVTCKPNE